MFIHRQVLDMIFNKAVFPQYFVEFYYKTAGFFCSECKLKHGRPLAQFLFLSFFCLFF